MTSKEALKKIGYLILQEVDNLKYKDLWKEALNIIKQDLERLETLERNSDKVIKDSVKLINRNLELQQENEKLKKEIEVLRDVYLITYGDLVRKCNNNMITQQEYELLKEVLGE